jgi:hypothetical protein
MQRYTCLYAESAQALWRLVGCGWMLVGFEFGWFGWLVLVLVLDFCGYLERISNLARCSPETPKWVSKEPGFGHISMAEPLGVHGIWYSIFHAPCNKIILSAPLLPEFEDSLFGWLDLVVDLLVGW